MTDNQLNYLNMANTITNVMDANILLWTANTKITAAVTNVKTSIQSINAAAGIQEQDKSGTTAAKNALWAVAATKAEHICAGLKSYYEDINDWANLAIVDFSDSDFSRGSAQVAASKMQIVKDKATGIPIASLTPFNVVAAEITGLQTAITAFTNSIPAHTAMQAASSAATDLIASLLTTLRGQMNKLDNLVGTLKLAQPTLVSTYSNARTIINLGKGQQAVEVHLQPNHFAAEFGKKFEIGDTFVVRNHSNVKVEVALTDTPTVMPTIGKVHLKANSELKLGVPEDFGGVFGHWLIVHNEDGIEDADVTVILAHGKSSSKAPSPGNVA